MTQKYLGKLRMLKEDISYWAWRLFRHPRHKWVKDPPYCDEYDSTPYCEVCGI